MAFQHGSHTRYSHTRASGTRPSTPFSSAVRRRRHYPRLAGPSLEPAVPACRLNNNTIGGSRLASRTTHRTEPALRTVRMVGPPASIAPTASTEFYRHGYSAGLTRFGQSPEGRCAAFLLAQEHALSTSYAYGYKLARFATYCGTSRCPLPASVETVGCHLGYLFRQGRVTGTSIRPYLAAIRAIYTCTGFQSPTEYPVITALRTGYIRATSDRVASRPSSVALPSSLGALALTRAIRPSRPSPDAAIATGFFLALRPMSIRGLHSDDFSLTPANAFFRLHREKGNAGQRRDRVIRLPLSMTPDSVFKLITFLVHCKAGKFMFPFSSAQLNHHHIRLSRKGAHSPPPLGRFTCHYLRSGCISAAHSIGVPLSRIMALTGHSSSQVLIRHYLDASISPCPSARDLFGRLLPPTSS
jgi:hypothetical protein